MYIDGLIIRAFSFLPDAYGEEKEEGRGRENDPKSECVATAVLKDTVSYPNPIIRTAK